MSLGVCPGQMIAGLVPQFADQDARIGSGDAASPGTRICADQLGLDGFPERLIDDRRMLAGIAQLLVTDAPDVDRVGQKVMQLPAAEGRDTAKTTGRRDHGFGA